ncbi:molybdopterin-guanine dinucleotide biosynthesis protein B [Helicobacter sp. 11S02596-1]|uniref:molybdopterin-guanine dinucleotide biosynthesis protein B n=1 Tax=Helicobacter sp. 11S02596-1 TaxID=1476194 RepID=UPI000BA7DBC1|nr:molybdopterin-guanine dinucleotide biosynthesis protein B [Helicobacter sp. 11S02596-1]PAF43954.1 molybdopterin-guanine dinucleotide biosynthesis protein B [Helicobacter sp. 11S02596-1]
MPKIVAFTGVSNSGKTTLIEKLVRLLVPAYEVAVFKHDPKDKAVFDSEGKDSHRFFQSGADVSVFSPSKTTMMFHQTKSMAWLCEVFCDKDYIFIEGLKELPFPRICVARGAIDEAYIPFSDAFALDKSVWNASVLSSHIAVLDLNDPQNVLAWIDKFGKEI